MYHVFCITTVGRHLLLNFEKGQAIATENTMTLRISGAALQVGNKTSTPKTPANGQDDNSDSLLSLTPAIVRIQK